MSRRAGAPPKPHVVIHAQKAIDFFVDQENLNPTDAEIVSQLQRQGMRSGTTADRIYDAAKQVRTALKGEAPRYAAPTGEPKEPIVAPAPKGQLPVPPAEGPKGPLTYAKRGDKFVVLNSKNEVVSEHSSRSEALRKASRELGMENDRAARSARFLRDENGRTPTPEELGLRPKEGEPGVFEGNVAEGTAKELEAALPKPGEEQYSPGVSALYEADPAIAHRVRKAAAEVPGWRKGIDAAHAAYEFFRNEVENSPVWKGLFPEFTAEKARGFVGQSEKGRMFLGLTSAEKGGGSGPNIFELATDSATREEFVARLLGVATHEFFQHGLKESSHKDVASSFTLEEAKGIAGELGIKAKGVHPQQKFLTQRQLALFLDDAAQALFKGKQGAPSIGKEKPGTGGLREGAALTEGALFDSLLEKFTDEDLAQLKKEGDSLRRMLAEGQGEALTAELRAELLKGQPLFMEKGAEGELAMAGRKNPYIIDAPSIARSSKKLKEQQKKIVGVGDLAYGYYVTNMIARLGTQLNNTRNVAVKASAHTLFDVLTMASPDSRARLRQRRRAILDAVKDGFIDTPSVIFTDKPATEGGKQIRALEEYGMKNLGKVIPSLFSQFSGEEIGTSGSRPERVLHALNLFGNIAERATVVNQIRISMAPLLEREGIAPGDYTTLLRKAAADKKLGERVTDALAQAAGDAGAIAFRRRPTIFKDERNAGHAVLEAWNNFHPAAKIALSEGVTGTPFVNAILANALPDVVESWPILSRLSKRFNKGTEYEKLAEKAGKGEKLAEKDAEKLQEFRNNAMQSKAYRRASQLTGPLMTLFAFGYYLTQDPKDQRAKGSLPTKEGWSTDVRNPLGSLYVGYALGEYLASAWKNRDKDKKMAPGKVGLGDLSPITQAVLQQRGSSQVGEGLLGQLAEATKPGAESFDYEKAFAKIAAKLGKNLPPSLLEGFGTDRAAKMPEAPQEGDIPGVSPFLRGAQERIPGKRESLPPAWDPTSGEPRKTGALGFQGLLPPETRYTPLRKYLDENADLFTNPPQLPRAKGEKLYDQRLMAAWKEKLDKGKVVVAGKGTMTLTQLLAAPMDEAKKAVLVEKALGQWTREASAAAQRGTMKAREPVPLELKKKEEEKAYREEALKGTKVAKPRGTTRPLRKSEIRNWGRYAVKGKLPARPTQ